LRAACGPNDKGVRFNGNTRYRPRLAESRSILGESSDK
jgi:hypothetical protein